MDGCNAISTNASGTRMMYGKRTRAPGVTPLKLLKAKRLIISAPAHAGTTNARIKPGRPTVVRSHAHQTSAATIAADDVLGSHSEDSMFCIPGRALQLGLTSTDPA